MSRTPTAKDVMSSLVGRHPTGPDAPGRASWLETGRTPGQRVDALAEMAIADEDAAAC
jgi:hypothetical protein